MALVRQRRAESRVPLRIRSIHQPGALDRTATGPLDQAPIGSPAAGMNCEHQVNPFSSASRCWGVRPPRGDQVADPLKAGQLLLLRRLRLGVDMKHVARLLPLVPLHRWFGIEVAQPVEPQAPHRSGQGGDGYQQQSGDLAEGASLMP